MYISSCKTKKDRQCNGQKNKNAEQSTTPKTKDRETWTPLKIGVNSGALEVLSVPAPYVHPSFIVNMFYYIDALEIQRLPSEIKTSFSPSEIKRLSHSKISLRFQQWKISSF